MNLRTHSNRSRFCSGFHVGILLCVLLGTATVRGQLFYTQVGNTIGIGRNAGATGDLVIPEEINGLPVTSVLSSAFYKCPGLTSLTLPESLTSIGNSSFYKCSGLGNLRIPDGVTTMGMSAFDACSGLTNVILGSGLRSISGVAFRTCTQLTEMRIPDGVTNIGLYAFETCTGLTNVTIGKNVVSIGEVAFGGCTGLVSMTIPDTVTLMGYQVFKNCSRLASVRVGDGLATIDLETFMGCIGLKSVTVGHSVTNIRNAAFDDCPGLREITFLGDAPSASPTVFSSSTNLTVYFVPGRKGWGSTFGGRPTSGLKLPMGSTIQLSYETGRNEMVLKVQDGGNAEYGVEFTEDFRQWFPLATRIVGLKDLSLLDPPASTRKARFYRLVQP